MKKRIIQFVLLICLLSGEIFADSHSTAELQTNEKSEWEFKLAPYLWMSGIKGKEGVVGMGPAVDVDMSFSDVAEVMDFGLMLVAEVRKGRWALVNDFLYLEVSGDATLTGPIRQFFKVQVDIDQVALTDTLAPSYRFVDEEKIKVDVLAGVRVWHVDTRLDVTVVQRPDRPPRPTPPGILPPPLQPDPNIPALPTIPQSASSKDSDTWMDPVVGLKLNAMLGKRLSVIAGGFFGIGDSDEDWSLVAMLNYDVKEWVSILAGYRHMSVDYEKKGFVYDVEMSGPILGLAFRF